MILPLPQGVLPGRRTRQDCFAFWLPSEPPDAQPRIDAELLLRL